MEMKLGPWPIGLDNLTADTSLPAGALRQADDVLIESNGKVRSGPGPRLALPAAGLRSLWTSINGASYAVQGSTLVKVTLAGLEPLGDIGGNGEASFADHAGQVLVGSASGGLFRIRDQAQPIALHAPSFSATPSASGGLDAGRYGVAVAALRDGEEFGLSSVVFVDVPQGGGLALSIAGGDLVRIYRTGANGDQLYRAVDAPAGIPGYLLGAGQLGTMPTGRFMAPMTGGHLMHSWSGRVLVARGRTLYYSQPMRPALCDPRHDFIQLPSRISMIAPVQDGVYLGDQQRTYFMSGTDPEQLAMRVLDAPPPPTGCALVVPGNIFPDIPDIPVALWLGASGFVLGLDQGQVVQRQASRLKIPRFTHGSLATGARRLFALAQ